MKCIILAAGYATRLYPLTENAPKPLLEVGGKAILDWLADDMVPLVDELVVVSNHRFFPHFSAWARNRGGAKVTVVDDGTHSNETRLGAVRDLQLAVDALGIAEDCVVMAGDNLLDFSLAGFVDFAGKSGSSCVMCHAEHRLEALRRTAVITTDQNNRITSFEEKPKAPRGRLAVPPFYFYRAADLARTGEALADGCGSDAPGSFAAWLSAKVPMHAYAMPGKRYDIGDLKSYMSVRETYRGIRTDAPLPGPR